jgi:hypothetical protein
MTNEEIYDTEIAPQLLNISVRCRELKMPFVASVEYERGKSGRTEFCPNLNGDERPSTKQLFVHYAARCNGNVDALIMAIIKDAEKYGHGSMYLHMLKVKTNPDNET